MNQSDPHAHVRKRQAETIKKLKKEGYPIFTLEDKEAALMFATTSPTARMAATRERRDGPIETMLGIKSTDPKNLEFADRLSRYANEIAPPHVDDLGRTHTNGVRASFNGIRHVPGYPMLNGTWPLMDNKGRRAASGLSNAWVKPEHRALFRAFVHVFFEDLEAVPLKQRKHSSTVNPYFLTDMSFKQRVAREAMRDAMEAGQLWMQGKFYDAYAKYHFGGCYYVVYRSQNSDTVTFADSVWQSKDLHVADLTYAVTGGEAGETFVSSKSLADADFWVPDGFFRTRLRTAMGLAYKVSCSLMPVGQSTRAKLYKLYPFAYHHTTRAQKEERLHQWDHTMFADVSDHDIFYPLDLYLPEITDVLLNTLKWSPWGVKIFEKSFRLPVYVGSPANGEGHVLLGDPFAPNLNAGLSSGHPMTDIMGTLNMAFNYALVQIEHTAPHWWKVVGQSHESACTFVRNWQRGELPFSAMLKSDDAAMNWRGAAVVKAALALHARLRDEPDFLPSPYVKISYEAGGKFLGDVALYGPDKSNKSIVMIADPISDLVNTIVPEYGVQSEKWDRTKVKRPYGGLAYASRDQVYGTTPVYGLLTEAMEKIYRDVRGESFHSFRLMWQRRDEALLSKHLASVSSQKHLGAFSAIDLEVLASPDKLEYKYTEADVSPEVTALLHQGIPVGEVAPYLAAFTNQRPSNV